MVLYQYFLFEEDHRQFADFLKLNTLTRVNSEGGASSYQQSPNWFTDFKGKKDRIFALITSSLKSGWRIERIPAFEKAIITSAIYTMQSQENFEKRQLSLLVSQTVDFSKKYLEKNKCGYINKLLDFAMKRTSTRKQIPNQGEELLQA